MDVIYNKFYTKFYTTFESFTGWHKGKQIVKLLGNDVNYSVHPILPTEECKFTPKMHYLRWVAKFKTLAQSFSNEV